MIKNRFDSIPGFWSLNDWAQIMLFKYDVTCFRIQITQDFEIYPNWWIFK